MRPEDIENPAVLGDYYPEERPVWLDVKDVLEDDFQVPGCDLWFNVEASASILDQVDDKGPYVDSLEIKRVCLVYYTTDTTFSDLEVRHELEVSEFSLAKELRQAIEAHLESVALKLAEDPGASWEPLDDD